MRVINFDVLHMNVFFEEDGHFKIASIMSESSASLQVETISGKRAKIKTSNVLMHFSSPLNGFLESANVETEQLELDFLWEYCNEAEFAFDDLAQDYYGKKPTEVQLAAIAIKLHSAPMYFYRKGKGRYKAAPSDTLKLALAAVERKKMQAEQMAVWVDMLKAGKLPEGFANKADSLVYNPDKNSLEWKAIDEAAITSGKLALTIMHESGLIVSAHDYHLGAFLREMFKDGTDFPTFAMPILAVDLPLAHTSCFSIDDATTTEIDDAFSIEILANGHTLVGIHIAAPSLAIAPETALDGIVLSRLSTVYMPGKKITMLPDEVVKPFSLDAGEIKPVLSLYLEVSAEFEIVSHVTRLERVYIADNLRHDSLEPYFNAETLVADSSHPYWSRLKLLHDLATKLEVVRGKADPNRAPQIDYNFYVTDGKVSIIARERGAPMDKLVAELMIYANSHWGGLLKDMGYTGIYRAQTGGKVFMTQDAEPHLGLGVPQYAWSTSPLRRAVDLINQRQIIAAIQQAEPIYATKDDKLKIVMRDFEQTYSAYSEFQSRMERYWSLQYLIQEQLAETTAMVWRENLVKIDGMFMVTKVPSLPELKVGTKVLLEIKHIDPLLMELNCKFKAVIESKLAVEIVAMPIDVAEKHAEA